MKRKTFVQKIDIILFATVIGLFVVSCKTVKVSTSEKKEPKILDLPEKLPVVNKDTVSIAVIPEVPKNTVKNKIPPYSGTSTRKYDPDFISNDSITMELVYTEMLQPISILKSTHPKIYWFIVSWLNTRYQTPNWDNYNSGDWRTSTKATGIDCSGFARVMQHEIFDRKIRGGSHSILDNFCTRIDTASATMGDLVFFRTPGIEPGINDKIVHVGVYLMNRYFVHATSIKSAKIGKGLNINSLDEQNWAKEFVTGGKIK